MEQFFLTPISAADFWSGIRKIVTEVNAQSQVPQAAQEPQQKFSISGLAEYLDCSKATIHAYKRRGIFPYYQTGRTIYFKKAEVDAALANKKKGATK